MTNYCAVGLNSAIHVARIVLSIYDKCIYILDGLHIYTKIHMQYLK